MKKTGFSTKLHKEGKLEIIEPSENLCVSYIQKSESHFESAKILLERGKLEESVSMAYYGMYHILLALLFKCGIKCENHTASILLLMGLFNESRLAEEISFGKKERIDKQYYADFNISKTECMDMTDRTEKFILDLKQIIKQLNSEKIEKLRSELNDALRE